MSLDLSKVAQQVAGMIAGLVSTGAEKQRRRQNALATLRDPAIDLADLKKKIAAGGTSWLVAGLTEGLSRRCPLPPAPADFGVLATDGSHIETDRHRAARCYLINVGTVALQYGQDPDASLQSLPQLFADEQDMVIANPGGGRDQLLDANLLGIKRSVEEWRALTGMCAAQAPGSATLALLDGTLIHWGLEGYPDFVADVLLEKGFLGCLDELQKLNEDRKLAVASYISFPGATDVANVLKVAVCPNDAPDCEHCTEQVCDKVSGVRDRELFHDLLAPGERSTLFISPSKIVRERYREHRVYFFYLKTDEEIARVEVPQWLAENEDLLGLTHALILDQCQRGQGYPVALSEAHEQAVVTGADRENFWEMVEAAMITEGLPTTGSVKALSKRTRWV